MAQILAKIPLWGLRLALFLVVTGGPLPGEKIAHAETSPPALARLVDVGADKCIPCIKMAPILEQLRHDFSGQMEVLFVDAWKDRDQAASYGVQMIPTQIFYAPDGKELFRHTGFYSREEILDRWQKLGYAFDLKRP